MLSYKELLAENEKLKKENAYLKSELKKYIKSPQDAAPLPADLSEITVNKSSSSQQKFALKMRFPHILSVHAPETEHIYGFSFQHRYRQKRHAVLQAEYLHRLWKGAVKSVLNLMTECFRIRILCRKADSVT